MTNLFVHFRFQDNVDVIWTICFFTGLCILCIAIFTFILIMQHLHCTARPTSSFSAADLQVEPAHVATYSTVSVIFAAICVAVTFSIDLICSKWSCWYTVLGWTYSILLWDSYILSKFFLYLIFIGRLFNPYYQRMYQYPKWVQYTLWMLLFIIIINMIIFNVDDALAFGGIQFPVSVRSICFLVYLIADFLLSVSTTILFFRPICRNCCIRKKNSLSDMSVVKKYGFVSTLQLIAALSFQFSYLVADYLFTFNIPKSTTSAYGYVLRVIQMVDCLLLMICIHLGFARKQTVWV